jgi:hypothetical protein
MRNRTVGATSPLSPSSYRCSLFPATEGDDDSSTAQKRPIKRQCSLLHRKPRRTNPDALNWNFSCDAVVSACTNKFFFGVRLIDDAERRFNRCVQCSRPGQRRDATKLQPNFRSVSFVAMNRTMLCDAERA